MVIDPIRRKFTGEAYTDSLRRKQEADKAKGGKTPPTAHSVSESAGEKIDVSDKAIIMGRIQKAIAEIADVRQELVDEIRERIERDEYHVPGEIIAEKVIREALKEMRSLGTK
ncbi:MAG: flagellar biosynthesis anti-sigma factor FlgM [bacterium]|nr:flagellar biosynthesis anti-sigma factor FlgM [bacterium]